MKVSHSIMALSLASATILGSGAALGNSLNVHTGPSYSCTEYNYETATFGDITVNVSQGPRGTDRTVVTNIPQHYGQKETKTFYNTFAHSQGSHMRWGYESVLSTQLTSTRHELIGALTIIQENQGPNYIFDEDGKKLTSSEYTVRNVTGSISFVDDFSGTLGNPISLACKVN